MHRPSFDPCQPTPLPKWHVPKLGGELERMELICHPYVAYTYGILVAGLRQYLPGVWRLSAYVSRVCQVLPAVPAA